MSHDECPPQIYGSPTCVRVMAAGTPQNKSTCSARQIEVCWEVFSPGLFGRLLASDRLLRGMLQARHLDPARAVSARSLSTSISMHSPTQAQRRASVAQHTVRWCCVPGKTKNTAQQKNQKRIAILVIITLFIMKPQRNFRDGRCETEGNQMTTLPWTLSSLCPCERQRRRREEVTT